MNRTKDLVDPDTITGRGVTIFLLDYFWLECGYYRDPPPGGRLSRTVNGYGGRWFSHTLPLFFEHGGCVVILPNDRWGQLAELLPHPLAETGGPGLGFKYLSVSEAERVHPLYVATARITDAGTGFLRGTGVQNERNNDSAVRQYLDPQKPFLVVFDRRVLRTADDALLELSSLINN